MNVEQPVERDLAVLRIKKECEDITHAATSARLTAKRLEKTMIELVDELRKAQQYGSALYDHYEEIRERFNQEWSPNAMGSGKTPDWHESPPWRER